MAGDGGARRYWCHLTDSEFCWQDLLDHKPVSTGRTNHGV